MPVAVDEESIIARVLARIPVGSYDRVVTVTPPEKLRKDFQREESERILAEAKELSTLQRRILKLVEGVLDDGNFMGLKAVSERLGRATSGGSWVDTSKAARALDTVGFVSLVERQGVRRNLREKIAADLAAYQATEQEVEAVYQNVLHEIATEGA